MMHPGFDAATKGVSWNAGHVGDSATHIGGSLPPNPPEILAGVESLQQAISMLDGELGEFMAKVSPVMRPDGLKEPQTGQTAMPTSTRIGSDLYAAEVRIRSMTDAVRAARNRVEL